MFATAILVGLVVFLFLRMWNQRRKLPPGPFPLPLIGNLHQFGYKVLLKKQRVVDALQEWAKEYGTVFTFWLGPMATVNICDYSTAVDAMVKKGTAFSDRKMPYLFNVIRKGRGIIVSNGSPWVEQRRFALHTLRNFGLGRNIIEERIMYEFEIACEDLNRRIDAGETSIDPYKMFDLLVGNIINRLLFTERFEKRNERTFFTLKKQLDEMMDNVSMIDLAIDKWNVNWPILKQRTSRILKPLVSIVDFIRSQVLQRKHAIASGTHVLQGEGEDFVDAFLTQMKKEQKTGVPTSFDDETLLMTLLDLWAAGQETTIVTLNWAFTYLLLNPEVISRLEEELRAVTGTHRALSIADRPNTPFFNATLIEILRCASIVPFNLWRDTSEDTIVGPYVIPKGTPITAQISLIMADEKFFKSRHKFNPDRYLSGNKLEQMVIPFGLGKRACIGESLARAELYLIIGNLLLRYDIFPDPLHMPSAEAKEEKGTMRRPKPYHIRFKRRSN